MCISHGWAVVGISYRQCLSEAGITGRTTELVESGISQPVIVAVIDMGLDTCCMKILSVYSGQFQRESPERN